MINLDKIGGNAISGVSKITNKAAASLSGATNKTTAAIDPKGAEKLQNTLDALANQNKPITISEQEKKLIKAINNGSITTLGELAPEEQTPAVVNALKAESKRGLGSKAHEAVVVDDGTSDYAYAPWMQRFSDVEY